jgi:hypothetical protein
VLRGKNIIQNRLKDNLTQNTSLLRKESYISHIKEGNPSVKLVSCADKLHNVRCILSDYRQVGVTLWERFSASKEETLWFYKSMAGVLCTSGNDLKVYADLGNAVNELEKKLSDFYLKCRSTETGRRMDGGA